jgi:hypothetical protein
MDIIGHTVLPDGTELRYRITDHQAGRQARLPDGTHLIAATDSAIARAVQRHLDPEGLAPLPNTGQPLQYDLLQALDPR